MASSERDMRKRIVAALRPLDALSVENGVGVGTPDVNFADGWLELKSMGGWPRDPEKPLVIEHFTPVQRMWLARRVTAGGRAYLLLKVNHDWLLFRGGYATDLVHRGVTRLEAGPLAIRAWWGRLDDAELLDFLRGECSRRT